MRERSGTRTEHAHRRIYTLLTCTVFAALGLSLMQTPSLAVQADSPETGARGVAPRPVPVAEGRTAGNVHAAASQTQTDIRQIAVPRVGAAHRNARPKRPASPSAQAQSQTLPVVADVQRATTSDFSLVGLTWRRGTAPADVAVQVRTDTAHGWSGWQDLQFEPGEGPAPGEESADARDGTEPLWVGSADGVDARVLSATGSAPADLELALVDPATLPGDAAMTTADAPGSTRGAVDASSAVLKGRPASTATMVATHRPHVVTRRQWGANRRLRSHCDSPRRANTVRMVFVHHTAGSNKYSRKDSPAIVRSIYAYHTQGQGWCDIGYNFLVDRFGTVFEGRAGGMNTPVRGAHAGDYNVKTVGVSLMGNFQKVRPTRAMKRGLTRVVAWKLSSYYRYPLTRARIAGKRFKKISGHRDAMSTACPGRFVYRWLPKLRHRVARRIGRVATPISRKWHALRRHGMRLGQPFRGETRAAHGGRKTQFHHGWVFWNKRPGAHPVRAGIYHRYRRLGLAHGRLGYPKSDIRHLGARRRQAFQHGRITWNRRSGRTSAKFF